MVSRPAPPRKQFIYIIKASKPSIVEMRKHYISKATLKGISGYSRVTKKVLAPQAQWVM